LNNLDYANALGQGVCVILCVITPYFAAFGEGFHRGALCFHTGASTFRASGG
jgi:hypothetical protein